MKTKNYGIHIIFLTAASVAGNAIISLSFLNFKSPLFTFLLCAVITLAAAVLAVPVFNRALTRKGVLFYLVSAALAAISLYGAAVAFSDYIKFLNSAVLTGSRTVSILLLAVVVVALTVAGSNAFLKFGLLYGVVTAAAIVFLFVTSWGIYSAADIKLSPVTFDFKNAFKCFFRCFSPVLSAVAFACLAKGRANMGSISAGTGIGLLLVLLCALQSLLVLGGSAADYEFPYLTAVSAYSSGQIYIRLDGFVWFIFFSATIIKAALCGKTAWLLIKRIFNTKNV